MSATADDITLTFPKSAVQDVTDLSAELLDKMHELLERNTDGTLSEDEKVALKTLVNMAQFSQLVTSAVNST